MSIEQKIADLLEESKKLQEEQVEVVAAEVVAAEVVAEEKRRELTKLRACDRLRSGETQVHVVDETIDDRTARKDVRRVEVVGASRRRERLGPMLEARPADDAEALVEGDELGHRVSRGNLRLRRVAVRALRVLAKLVAILHVAVGEGVRERLPRGIRCARRRAKAWPAWTAPPD